MFGDFLGNLEKHHFKSPTAVTNVGQILKHFGQLFNPTSGHTDHNADGSFEE